MGDMNFPDPNTTAEHDGWEWDSEKWTKWGSGGSGGDNTTSKNVIASGVMATGEMVVVNADGTVSVVEATATPGGDAPSELGEGVEFYANNAGGISSAYDANSEKIVVAYVEATSSFGAAILGEIVGDRIVFGVPVYFNSNSCLGPSVCFDQSSGKFVIAYQDSSGSSGFFQMGRAVAGQVVGNTIAWDSPVTFESAIPVYDPSATYDSSAEKVVIAYQQGTNGGRAAVGSFAGGTLSFGSPKSFYTGGAGWVQSAYDPISESTIIAYLDEDDGRDGKVLAGKISGNSINFGAPVLFNTGAFYWLSVTHDHASKKMVIGYVSSVSNKGSIVVCTVLGNAISCGTPVDFADTPPGGMTVGSDPALGKVVIFYSAGGGGGNVIAGEVSGDSITLEAALVFSNTAIGSPALCFDPSSKKSGIFYSDTAFSKSYGRVYSPGGKLPDILGTNLTSDNFIGVSKGNYADGDEATVQIAGINSDQQGMTVGKQYIQLDGTLEITEGDPSVLAGTAISSTELNIKDLA